MASGGGGGGNGQELRMESASSPKLSAQLGAIREVAGITVGGPASHFPASHRPPSAELSATFAAVICS